MSSSDPYSRFTPGQRIRETLSATRQNALTDAAMTARGQRVDFTDESTQAVPYDPTVILVQNDTGGALPYHSVLSLRNGVLVTPAANLEAFQNGPSLFHGVAPNGPEPFICITLEPAAAGALVPAVVSGLVAVQIPAPPPGAVVPLLLETASASTDRLHLSGGSGNVSCALLVWVGAVSGGLVWGLVNIALQSTPFTTVSLTTPSTFYVTNTIWFKGGVDVSLIASIAQVEVGGASGITGTLP